MQLTAPAGPRRSASLRTNPLYVEISPLLAPHITGIGRFVARLVETLSHYTALRLVTTVSGSRAQNMNLRTDLECGEEIVVAKNDLPPADSDLDDWTRRLLRRPHQRHNIDLAGNCVGLYTLLRPRERHFAREIGIFYDFTPAVVPWAHTDETREHFGIFFTETSGLCDNMLAISESTKRDASWLSAAQPDDVFVAYPGPSLCVERHASTKPVQRTDNRVLVVSTLEPRKNGRFLLDWFMDTQALSADVELCWVGPNGWLSGEKRLSRQSRGRQVRFLGLVPDARLCELYRQAAVTIYPSLYEGFGFPVLDALRHGARVMSAYHSSLQEFEGPGVYFFDPCDSASLDAAYGEMASEASNALEWADLDERYSWDKLAETMLAHCGM